jgi:hypothetical protein
MYAALTQTAFVVSMLVMACIGAYCAHKMTDENPCWVRVVVLAPAIMGMFAPVIMLTGAYVPYTFDVIFAITVTLLYALVASRFSSKPWLDIKTSQG